MDKVVTKLQYGEPLEPKYKDHPLKGDKLGFRDCHILPDWVLIYQIVEIGSTAIPPALDGGLRLTLFENSLII